MTAVAAQKPVELFHSDLDWYRATYNAAVAQVLLHDISETPKGLEEAEALALELAVQIELALIESFWPEEPIPTSAERHAAAQALAPFLTEVEPTALILLAGILRRKARGGGVDELLAGTRPTDHENGSEERRSPGSLRDLRLRLGLLNLLRDPSMTHLRLVGWVDENLDLDYRARYNFACYFSGLGDDLGRDDSPLLDLLRVPIYKLALQELERSLLAATNDLVSWAETDPALRGVREGPTHAAFRLLIEEVKSGEEKLPESEMDAEESHRRLRDYVARSLSRFSEVTTPYGEDQPDLIVRGAGRTFAGLVRAEERLSVRSLRHSLQRLADFLERQPEIEGGFLAVPDSALVSPVAPPPGIVLLRASDADEWVRQRLARPFEVT
jgi:hypothetical protein